MTRVWSNKKINSVGITQSELLVFNSFSNNSHSKADSDLGDDNEMKNDIILDTDNDTDLRKEERLENQNELSNVKIFIENKLYNKR